MTLNPGHRLQKWVVEAEPGSRVTVLAESDSCAALLEGAESVPSRGTLDLTGAAQRSRGFISRYCGL